MVWLRAINGFEAVCLLGIVDSLAMWLLSRIGSYRYLTGDRRGRSLDIIGRDFARGDSVLDEMWLA